MRKLHNDGRPIDIDDRLPVLEEALRAVPGLTACYLFGSYGTEWQTPLSDVDLALVFRPGRPSLLPSELDLIGTVTGSLREDDVSVTVLNRAPLALRFDVLAKGRPLFVFDEIALADFIEETIDRHGDFAVDRDRFLTEYDRALVEDYANGAR
ncbi:MAG TPA: nucleotidyltransferase domain-containing protein [Thermoanaerobaculia bacterium]|nr:nucleotidyltransferase domain-containing protein [Thermoanaerobaculia bacterium]